MWHQLLTKYNIHIVNEKSQTLLVKSGRYDYVRFNENDEIWLFNPKL